MKLILNILLILVIISTISICAIQPEMHKNVIVYDSSYTLVTEQEVKTEIKNVPVMEMPVKPVQTITTVKQNVTPITNETTKTQVNTQKPKTTKTVQKSTINKPATTQIPVTKHVKTETVKAISPKKEEIKAVIPQVQKTVTEPEPIKLMTQQEETIAWNIWRSNLTNSIMRDTKLPDLPNGVLFQFSFTVDKYGKITGVQTGANPSNYTPYAIQYVAPVIRSYQGKSILNFPEGTARTVTQVTGKWRISNSEKFSTPQDYNDIERVVR